MPRTRAGFVTKTHTKLGSRERESLTWGSGLRLSSHSSVPATGLDTHDGTPLSL